MSPPVVVSVSLRLGFVYGDVGRGRGGIVAVAGCAIHVVEGRRRVFEGDQVVADLLVELGDGDE
jgi:hypothetical protein